MNLWCLLSLNQERPLWEKIALGLSGETGAEIGVCIEPSLLTGSKPLCCASKPSGFICMVGMKGHDVGSFLVCLPVKMRFMWLCCFHQHTFWLFFFWALTKIYKVSMSWMTTPSYCMRKILLPIVREKNLWVSPLYETPQNLDVGHCVTLGKAGSLLYPLLTEQPASLGNI